MSVMIKEIDMPDRCRDCPCYSAFDLECNLIKALQRADYSIPISTDIKRLDNCPMEPVESDLIHAKPIEEAVERAAWVIGNLGAKICECLREEIKRGKIDE